MTSVMIPTLNAPTSAITTLEATCVTVHLATCSMKTTTPAAVRLHTTHRTQNTQCKTKSVFELSTDLFSFFVLIWPFFHFSPVLQPVHLSSHTFLLSFSLSIFFPTDTPINLFCFLLTIFSTMVSSYPFPCLLFPLLLLFSFTFFSLIYSNRSLSPLPVSCTEDLSGSLRGQVTPPGSPNPYAEDAHCSYSLAVEEGLQLVLEFTGEFDVEAKPNGECADAVRVRLASALLRRGRHNIYSLWSSIYCTLTLNLQISCGQCEYTVPCHLHSI